MSRIRKVIGFMNMKGFRVYKGLRQIEQGVTYPLLYMASWHNNRQEQEEFDIFPGEC